MIFDAMMSAVLERPDDDGPRLVLADWLDEQGDPRGEFIRTQVELARTGPSDGHRENYFCLYEPPCRWHALRHLERLRWAGCWRSVVAGLPHTAEGPTTTAAGEVRCGGPVWPVRYTAARGFVEEVQCLWPVWRAAGPWLVRMAPLRRVRLLGYEPAVRLRMDGTIDRAEWGATSDTVDLPHRLPNELHWLLATHPGSSYRGSYPSAAEANAALSAAALDWAVHPWLDGQYRDPCWPPEADGPPIDPRTDLSGSPLLPQVRGKYGLGKYPRADSNRRPKD